MLLRHIKLSIMLAVIIEILSYNISVGTNTIIIMNLKKFVNN